MIVTAPFGISETHGILNRHLAARQASSDGFGWSSIYASAQRERPFKQTFSPVPDLLIVMHRNGPASITGMHGKKQFSYLVPAGGIHIIPGASEFSINLADELDTLHVYLRSSVIDAVAQQLATRMGRDIRILPGLIVCDRILQSLLETVFLAIDSDSSNVSVNIDFVAKAIAAHMLQNYSNLSTDAISDDHVQPSVLPANLQRAIRYMETNMDSSISLDDIADEVNWSASHLAREFRVRMGMPPHRYLIKLRVDRARELLESSNLPIAEIAFECGFSHQEHMTRHFKRMCAATPAAHRRNHRQLSRVV